MSQQNLSQDEVDALLQGMTGDVPVAETEGVRPPKGMYGESNSIRYLPRNADAVAAQAPGNSGFRSATVTTVAPPNTPAANGLPWKRQA